MHSLTASSGDAAFAGGQQLDVYTRLSQTLSRAQRRLRIIDPYLDDVIVTDYLDGMRTAVQVELLTSDRDVKCFARLRTAGKRLVGQHGTPLAIRQSRAIHDRVIFIDQLDGCVVMGSSIRDAATRKPTYLAMLDPQIGAEKRLAYDEIWNHAAPVVL